MTIKGPAEVFFAFDASRVRQRVITTYEYDSVNRRVSGGDGYGPRRADPARDLRRHNGLAAEQQRV